MARQVRIESPGAFYHITARGNERRPIVRDDADRRQFLKTPAASLDGAGARLHAYCLTDNPYHLLVETPHGDLARFVRRLDHAYALGFNRRHRRVGHLFQGRLKAILAIPVSPPRTGREWSETRNCPRNPGEKRKPRRGHRRGFP